MLRTPKISTKVWKFYLNSNNFHLQIATKFQIFPINLNSLHLILKYPILDPTSFSSQHNSLQNKEISTTFLLYAQKWRKNFLKCEKRNRFSLYFLKYVLLYPNSSLLSVMYTKHIFIYHEPYQIFIINNIIFSYSSLCSEHKHS